MAPDFLELTPHNPDVPESLVRMGDVYAKLIGAHFDDLEELILGLHGLPGVESRQAMIEAQARELVKQRNDVAVLVAIASGVSLSARHLGLADPKDLRCVVDSYPGLFRNRLSIQSFIRELSGIIGLTRRSLRDHTDLRLAAHSYGGSAGLIGTNQGMLSSAHLLAPFVLTSMTDPRYALNVRNQAKHPNHVAPQESVLWQVLSGCKNFYSVPEGGTEVLIDGHRALFNARLFDEVLSKAGEAFAGIPVHVVLGGEDGHIGVEHAEFIEGLIPHAVRHVLPEDTHDLESWDIRSVLRTSPL